ncbi:MAG: penicillin-binding transpeptidase domain-containing protein, partial [Rhodoferax sp.]|nr:penicillin-binding transpeptidase domain-containing protein [Rhodoferax sp.]
LFEMVSAYGTIANGGAYLEPMLVTRIENRAGDLLAEFQPASPEAALSARVNYTLLDAMRGVVDKGTGAAIRSRYGIRADVAGKTGTTQDNADGWFILMHPQLVTGAWVGFNDGRVTLRSNYWGQGAHSALPIVGDFTAQALRARIIDARARFAEPQETSLIGPLLGRLRDWANKLMGIAPEEAQRPVEPTPVPPPAQDEAPQPELLSEPLPAPVDLPAVPVEPVNVVPPAAPASAPAGSAPEPATPVPAEVKPPGTEDRAP